ncbi:hypothetical protein SO802_016204 [Lithocarpus litseifolius]|uniref:Nuclease HARBI1 n=1 Tax=Lithocarpus litseifolius TaxID=425828 RepID=A0AAW2CYC1_9ROSI
MSRLRSSEKCYDVIRMGPHVFQGLCDILQRDGDLQDTQRATVEEQVGKFLHMLSHNVTTRIISFFICCSSETISRHFHNVLRSIIMLEDQFLQQLDRTQVPLEILQSSRFNPYFKDCIGALDGTHVRVKVSNEDALRYRGSKGYTTQNVLVACSFDLKFTYVLPGWEGIASNSRIIKSTLTSNDNLKIPQGKYYLVDVGYMNRICLITPYMGARYHLKEYSIPSPKNAKKLFNLRHASLRNAIKRAFGVLKKRFSIIASTTEPTYCVDTQNEIILSCCILHNYLMGVDPDESLIAEVDEEVLHSHYGRVAPTPREDDEDTRQGDIIRDSIASTMWQNYVQM